MWPTVKHYWLSPLILGKSKDVWLSMVSYLVKVWRYPLAYVKNILQDLDPNNTVVGSLSSLDESRKMYQNKVYLKQYDIVKYNLLCLWVTVKGILIS